MQRIDGLLDTLRDALIDLHSRRFIVAFSGGIDSHALLHAMTRFLGRDKSRLVAAHIDHGLHADSRAWALQCVSMAAGLGIEATVLTLDESPPAGESIEAWARRHRYHLLTSLMGRDDVLLTAHHRDDQVETLLLQLFRGAGPHGLASIPARQGLGPGLLVRPLINVTRGLIESYAEAFGLDWIEDPSNAADAYDRNYVRHQILPAIVGRWPAASTRIAHAAVLQQQAAACLDAAADVALDGLITDHGTRITFAPLLDLEENLRRWVLRRWIVRAEFPIPDAVHLREMERSLAARSDAIPCVSWKGAEMRRYRDSLHLMAACPHASVGAEYAWDLIEPLSLPHGLLSADTCIGSGLNKNLVGERGAVVRFRRGGERCHPNNRAHSQSLKRLFQEWGVAPWKRDRIPLIFVGAEIAAVGDICVTRRFAAGPSEEGWSLCWAARGDNDRSPIRSEADR